MKNLILGSLLGGLAMFVLGAAYWMNPLPMAAFGEPTDDTAVQRVLRENLTTSGAYFIPNPHQDPEQYMKKSEAGPVAVIQYYAAGIPQSDMGKLMGLGLLQQIVSAFLLALLMKAALPGLPGYVARVKFAALSGVVGTFFISAGNMIWWHQGLAFTLFTAVYHALGFTVAGLVLARFIRPESAPEPAPAEG